MKLSLRSTRRAADRKAAKANAGNPVAGQARLAIDLLETHLIGYIVEHKPKIKAVPIEIVHLYTGIIVDGAKGGANELHGAGEIKIHSFIVKEIETMLGVFGASCKKYCDENATDHVPMPVVTNLFEQVRKRIGG